MRAALVFGYDGGMFDGYARQRDESVRTVEAVLLDTLRGRGLIESLDAAKWRSGSRTDRGVSAVATVATFEATVPPERIAPAIGDSIVGLWPLASCVAPLGYDARHAGWRHYRYFLSPADVRSEEAAGVVEAALQRFEGTHDFSAFARVEPGRNPMRTIRETGLHPLHRGCWAIDVRGRAFLWNQVRRMVAAALAVADGRATLDDIDRALLDPTGAPDLGLARAEGLVLWEVDLAGLPLAVDRACGERQRTLLTRRSVTLEARAGANRAAAAWLAEKLEENRKEAV